MSLLDALFVAGEPAAPLMLPDSVQKANFAETVHKIVNLDVGDLLRTLLSQSMWILLNIAVALAIGIAAGGGGIGMGLATAKSAEGISRQPEAEGKIRTMMMLGLVFIETAIIYALLVVILIIFVL